MELKNFKWDQDADGIVTLSWDVPGRTMNVLTSSAIAELAQVAGAVAGDAAIKGLVITSGKANGFCAGAALDEMESGATFAGKPATPEEAVAARYQGVMQFHNALRKLETCGKPVAAAINGLALGGGLEVTLACHYRVVADNPKIQLGLPEAKVGLLPGGGGTQRLPRLVGAMAALPMLLQGASVDPQKALGMKLVHAVAPLADLVANAKAWVKANPKAAQPWDAKDFKAPGGGPFSPGGGQVFTMGNAMLRKESYGNYPAQKYILSCVYEGLQVPIDAGLRIEARYFTKLMMQPESRNMIRSLFLSMQDLGKGARRPKSEKPTETKIVGILGAGVMGGGIAYVAALAGIDVVLVDTTQEKAQGGKDHVAGILDKQIERGKSSPEKKAAVLAHIQTTADFADLKDADFVIEAVFEDRAVKAEATKKACAAMKKGAVFGSNTSTLPITGLSEASDRPELFIGVHFFSPVDRMGLVEVIRGKQTGDHALAVAMDFVQKIKKTPIVVNDSRGFYTSRCFGTYTREGMAMLAEGIHPAMIENVGRMAGMPMGSLEVVDSVGIDTALKVGRQMRKDMGINAADPSEEFLSWVVEKNGRLGRKNSKGFYDYDAKGKRVRIWPELLAYKGGQWNTDADVEVMKQRFLTIQALEAARCFEEGVITDPRDADVGAILGWGYAPFTGGPVSYIDTTGAKAFVARCDAFAARYGDRFKPNQLLRDMAAKGETFYARFAPVKQAA
ncbi:MAG TPA: 3-hydroxyacyl-CoA dehydrogenase NAD-binding domain-containing protein [Rhizomicrobium sp.]|jgi:3-hydroxyacyl-CoA dehydrogenase/enoyl-CoA hydratase/3-hydroxybutyryl-CoA epimerase|nr:3-hydroxyacyl-CoA dehydrogenase NAD-binding domain-containing protein [Rhizomicrobium sp.]